MVHRFYWQFVGRNQTNRDIERMTQIVALCSLLEPKPRVREHLARRSGADYGHCQIENGHLTL